MSTQSPHPPTPKGPRNGNSNNTSYNNNNSNPRRSSKKNPNTTPHAHKVAMLSTPPSSPPRNVSPGIATDTSANPHAKKKPPRSAKKMPNGNRASPAPNGVNGHQRQSSQPSNTPAKDAAYAGPTFHASPAPSALPMPSFFSKSYPESDLPTTFETDSEENEPPGETTPSKPRAARPQPPPSQPQSQPQSQPAAQHKPSPLDFLFEAAKRSRNPDANPISSPEAAATARVRSPQTDSKALHGNNTPGGGMFAFEMGSPERTQIGPSFAPSYQDRMNALRASSSPSHTQSQPALNNTEDHRRMKTEELKHLLLNPRPQKPPSSLSPPNEKYNYAPQPNGHANIPHYATPMRTTSGPPTTMSHGPSQPPPMPANYPYNHMNGSHSQNFRNTNSPLRRELPHNSASASPTPYGHYYTPPAAHSNYVLPQPQYTNAAFPMPTQSPSPTKSVETKQIEDDLRRVLKIGGPGIPSGGIQSPFAA